MQESYKRGPFDRQPTSQLLLVAEQVDNGLCVAEEMVPGLEAQFIDFYEQPFRETYDHRQLVAHAATKLAGRSPVALDLVIDSALRYAVELKEIDDADPYSPNSVEILAGVPRSEKVISVLKQIISEHPGMAQGDAAAALRVHRGGGPK